MDTRTRQRQRLKCKRLLLSLYFHLAEWMEWSLIENRNKPTAKKSFASGWCSKMGQGWNPNGSSIAFLNPSFVLDFCVANKPLFFLEMLMAVRSPMSSVANPTNPARCTEPRNAQIVAKYLNAFYCISVSLGSTANKRTHDANAVDSIRSKCTLCTLLLRSTFAYSLSLSFSRCP